MRIIFRVALLGAVSAAAWTRPVTLEPVTSFSTPDPAYTTFASDVAIDGNYAIVTAGRTVPDPGGNPQATQNYATAFLFQRSGTRWLPLRRLDEYRQDPLFEIPHAVAMQDGLAAVQTVETDIYELGTGGWVRAPAELTRDGPGVHLAIDAGRIVSGDSTGSWSARVFEENASGTWVTAALLRGKTRSEGSDDEFRGGPADISGNWVAVQQLNGDLDPTPETFLFHDFGDGNGWYLEPYGSARAPAGASRFGPEVAIRWPDVFVAGGNESGTYVFREVPAMGFELATRIQALDSFMGSGPAGRFARSDQFLLQHAWSHDRNAYVVNAFVRNPDAEYEHVAVLAARNGESLGVNFAISGRRVLASGADGQVHYFIIPLSLATPEVRQDTFATGEGTGWAVSAGSQFTTAARGTTRVFRQLNIDVLARAVLQDSDFTSQSVEADVRPLSFAASSSGVGLLTRFQNPQNFYQVLLRNNGRVELRRMASGTSRLLASAAFSVTPNRNYRLRIESIGTLHRVYIDGRLVLDADSAGPTHGRAAVVTDRARAEFDNVIVSPTLFTTLYASDFEGESIGQWTLTGTGFWNLWPDVSQVLFQSSVAGDARASIGVPTDDQVVRVRARLDTFATATGTQERWFGLMARQADARNYYYLSLRSSNTIALRKVVDGRVTTLASAPFVVNPHTWYRLRLDAVGDQIRAYVNDNLRLEATDTAHASGSSGPVMFRAAADYDDFLAYQP